VIDYQNDFVDGALGFPGAEKLDAKIAAKVRAYGKGKVLFTRDTHFENYLQTREGKNLPVEHCIEGTWGWELAGELELLSKGKLIFNKPTFGSVELAKYLTEENEKETIEAIELCGLCTDICVISNAFVIKANLTEVPVVVDASCCAGVTPESHLNALSAMKMCQVTVVNEQESTMVEK
jgi:nicotinamidase-related amidase